MEGLTERLSKTEAVLSGASAEREPLDEMDEEEQHILVSARDIVW